MGESLFLEPMSRLFQKLRSKRAPKPAEPGAEDQIRAVRGIFDVTPTPTAAVVQPSPEVEPEPEPAGPDTTAEPAPEAKLDEDLVQGVFGGRAAAASEAPAERADAPRAETSEGQAGAAPSRRGERGGPDAVRVGRPGRA